MIAFHVTKRSHSAYFWHKVCTSYQRRTMLTSPDEG
jgi:hypothetical protein